jgi:hypothetical protein
VRLEPGVGLGPGAGELGAGWLGAGWLESGWLEPRRRITGAEMVGSLWMGAGLLGARPELKSKPHASQNWPDRSVPQFGHGCAAPGAVAPPGVPGWPGEWPAAAGTDPPIRIPHVSQ